MISKRPYAIAVFFVLIASITRLWNLDWNPAWYTDEGTHIDIARHLMHGKIQYLGITESYLIAARLPLFEYFLALWFQLVGVSMLSLRILTSLMGILSTALIFRVVVSASGNRQFGLVAMGLFALYPQAVIYSRFGFSYNLLPVLILLGIWQLSRYHQTKHLKTLITVSLLFGLSTISDFIAFSFLPPLLIFIFRIQRKHAVIAVMGLIAPFAIYALFEVYNHADVFLYDLSYTLSRAGGKSLTVQFDTLINNLHILLTESWWIPIGAIGLSLIQPNRLRWVIILFLGIPILIMGRTAALYNLSAYYMIPLLPFVAIGISALLTYGLPYFLGRLSISRTLQKYIFSSVFTVIFIGLSWNLINNLQHGFPTGIEHFLVNAEEAHQTQDALVDYTNSDDFIIASPTVAWMFDANVTDYQLASLAKGNDGVFFPADLYPNRFAYEVNYTQATYAVVDNLWRDWGAVHMPSVANMLADIQNWELIFQTNTIQIYRNPQIKLES